MNEHPNWPSIVMYIWSCFSIGYMLAHHGKTSRVNVPMSFLLTTVQIFLLIAGGFFHAFHWPQLVYCAMTGIGVVLFLIKDEVETTHGLMDLVFTIFFYFLYYKGGMQLAGLTH